MSTYLEPDMTRTESLLQTQRIFIFQYFDLLDATHLCSSFGSWSLLLKNTATVHWQSRTVQENAIPKPSYMLIHYWSNGNSLRKMSKHVQIRLTISKAAFCFVRNEQNMIITSRLKKAVLTQGTWGIIYIVTVHLNYRHKRSSTPWWQERAGNQPGQWESLI